MPASARCLAALFEVQRLAAGVVGQVLSGRSLAQALPAAWAANRHLEPDQRAATQDLVYGTLRHQSLLAASLAALIDRPLKQASLRNLLLVTLYQLQFSKTAPYAVVDHAVRAADGMGLGRAKGLVNAVLRNFLRRRDDLLPTLTKDPATRYSYPDWWVRKVRSQYPVEWELIMAAGNQHPPMTLRVNRRCISREDYMDMLREAGMEARELPGMALALLHPVSVDRLPGFDRGLVSVQDAGAQAAAGLMAVAPGMRVLDACSAPGGKAAHLLESQDLDLTALDQDAGRLEKVGAGLARLGLSAALIHADAARPELWWDGKPFDRILADVPCTASGVVRRHPDIKWLRKEEDIGGFAEQQSRILDALWHCLAGGGKLLYATCSIFAEENSRQIEAFLARHQDARRVPLTALDSRDGQLIPNDLHDGFYYAMLEKT